MARPDIALRSMFCPKCLGPMIRDTRLEAAPDVQGILMTVEVFECAAGCESQQPEAQERA